MCAPSIALNLSKLLMTQPVFCSFRPGVYMPLCRATPGLYGTWQCTTKFGSVTEVAVSQCWLHTPQLLPNFQTFAARSAVFEVNSTWGRCSKHYNATSEVHANSQVSYWHASSFSMTMPAAVPHKTLAGVTKLANTCPRWGRPP